MRRQYRLAATVAVTLLINACGEREELDSGTDTGPAPLLTAATLGAQAVLPASDYLSAPPYSVADRSNGSRQAQVCRACHSFDKGGPNMIGPALYGFFGTAAGTRDGFDYSPVIRNANFVWTPRALDAWLAQPGRFLPGNRMTFAGVADSDDRDDLIAYLLEATTRDDDG